MEVSKQFIFSTTYFSPDVEHCEKVDNLTFIVKIYNYTKEKSGLKAAVNKITKAFMPLENKLGNSILNYTIPGIKKPTPEKMLSWLWQKLSTALPSMTKLEIQIR